MPSKEKKLCRHKRRRLATKLEWQRRQQEKLWLFNHIWHAKRFHMVTKWGYKLPMEPTDKSRLRIYRAAIRSAYIHDSTYMECLQFRGKPRAIQDVLSCCLDPNLLPLIHDRFLSGNFKGVQRFYQPNRYPQSCIAPVSFIWSCTDGTQETDNRTLMIWFHPSVREDMLAVVSGLSWTEANVKFEHCQRRWSQFQLRGPRSHEILQWILKNPNENSESGDKKGTIESAWDLWNSWSDVPSSQLLPSDLVLSLQTACMPSKYETNRFLNNGNLFIM